MSSLTDSEVISTLDRYRFLRLGDDPTPDRRLEDWLIGSIDLRNLSNGRNTSPSERNEAAQRSVDSYQIDESHIHDRIVSTTRRDLPLTADIDAYAWYLPIHFHGPEWGIYLREDAIEMFAGHIWDRLRHPTRSPQEIRQVWEAATYTLYLHEAFHHKMESFAIRLEIARLRPTFIPYFDGVYRASQGTDDQLEEIIATREMYRRLKERTYKNKLSDEVRIATLRFLEDLIPTLPPSYRLGLSRNGDHLNELCSQISEASLGPGQPAADWNLAPNMTRSIFNRTTDVYILVPKTPSGAQSSERVAFASISRRQAINYIRKVFNYVQNGGSGGHTKFSHEHLGMIIIPSARELSPPVARSTAKTLGMTVREFSEAVRNF